MANRRRELLSRAASGEWVNITSADNSEATNASLSRAARALIRIGLAETKTASSVIIAAENRGDHATARRVDAYCLRHDLSGGRSLIKLTPLGAAVVRFFAKALEAGRAIRWDRFFAAVERGQVMVA